ncbi:FAD:protein FMN transferase [Pseudomonas sp. SA3-5]|uniref:FAD:protein FMN transferase n=1 Tax=Pseudomonas aestuarii TaxID=3018340 RepID=A0ABT4XJ85_9PSED|nr:FAD:protein FMN transferase [Pseudomonas aestuarii]MDA7088291.1 FAD:protein FMN transferase [Pseudomonas aestuarii]
MSTETPPNSAVTLQRYSLNGATMGTRYSALFFAAPGLDESAIAASLFAAVDQVDRQMSSWKADSALSRLNALPEQQWLDIPPELLSVLATGLRIGRQSNGAFDIGVGDLVNAWGFGPGGQVPTDLPAQRRRQQATEVLEVDQVHHRVRKRAPITLDLSGIAKGFGVDQLAHCLEGWGVSRYLVGIDGEMRACGLKADGQAWTIAVEKPVRGVREVMGVMELSDVAIATSGDYRHWVEIEHQDYSHSMDPALGAPACNQLAAVTVLASSCMLADAWATALLVLGEVAGPELAQARGMDALFVVRDGQGFRQLSIVAGQLEA